MKKTKSLLCVLLLSLLYMGTFSCVWAEDYMDDYKKVKRQVPRYIEERIIANAAKKYPDNDRLKQYTVEIQKRAYFKVKDYKNDKLPSQQLNLIIRNAERDKPYDYGSQLLVITKEVNSYIEAHSTQIASEK